MRVLLIDVNCKFSSTGKIVYDLYSELNRQGHLSSIAYGRGPKIKEANIFKFGIDIETYIHAFLTRVTGINGYFSFLSTIRLINYIESFNPDVVHIHELHSYFVNYETVIKYLKKNRIKTVWTFHCDYMFTGKCGYSYECNRWKETCYKCPQLSDYPKSIFFDFTTFMHNRKKAILSDFDCLTIVTPSTWLAKRVEESFIKSEVKVINNGINTNLFKPKVKSDLKFKYGYDNKILVLGVAPDIFSERKGGDFILKIARNLDLEKYIFILIGHTSNYTIGNVRVIKKTSNQEELAEYYSMADIFLITSKMENFPTTCLEAASSGAYIIGFDSGGTKETIPEFGGELVKYGDILRVEELIKNQSFETYKPDPSILFKNSKERMIIDYIKLYEEQTIKKDSI